MSPFLNSRQFPPFFSMCVIYAPLFTLPILSTHCQPYTAMISFLLVLFGHSNSVCACFDVPNSSVCVSKEPRRQLGRSLKSTDTHGRTRRHDYFHLEWQSQCVTHTTVMFLGTKFQRRLSQLKTQSDKFCFSYFAWRIESRKNWFVSNQQIRLSELPITNRLRPPPRIYPNVLQFLQRGVIHSKKGNQGLFFF